MNRLLVFFKKSWLSYILASFLTGILLIANPAWSIANTQADQAESGLIYQQLIAAANGQENPRPEVPKDAVTSPYEGGMNEYSDVDPRTQNTTGAKAEGLVENAESNLEKRADSPGKLLRNYRQGTPLGERVRKIGEDVGSSVEDLTEGVSGGTKQGVENIKENLQP